VEGKEDGQWDCEFEMMGKTKKKEKASKRKIDSDSDSEVEEEEHEYDLSGDAQLSIPMDSRLGQLKVGSKIEVQVDTNYGPGWFDGVVAHVGDNGVVRWVEDDDGTVWHDFDLKSEIWKFLY